jgi:hypothetical protein
MTVGTCVTKISFVPHLAGMAKVSIRKLLNPIQAKLTASNAQCEQNGEKPLQNEQENALAKK